MKCEICHKADAKVAVRRDVGGKERELYVCRECAAKGDGAGDDASAPGLPPPEDVEAIKKLMGEIPPEAVVGALFQQIFGPAAVQTALLDNPTNPIEPGDPCHACWMRPDDYKRTGRLGCAVCYDAFARQLAPLIRDMHPGVSHAGKVPESPADGADQNDGGSDA